MSVVSDNLAAAPGIFGCPACELKAVLHGGRIGGLTVGGKGEDGGRQGEFQIGNLRFQRGGRAGWDRAAGEDSLSIKH